MPRADAGSPDAGAVDAGRLDAGLDAGPPPPVDAGPVDSGPVDAGPLDAGAVDAGPIDAGPVDAGPIDAGPVVSPACTGALASTHNNFETEADGWTIGELDGVTGSWPYNPWQWGAPSAGQPTCPEGVDCLGTDLDDNYAQCGRGFIKSRAFDVSACGATPLALVITHQYDFWTGSYGGVTWTDGGLIEVSADGGSTWLPLDPSVYPGTVRINPHRGSSYECVRSGSFYVQGRPGFVGANAGWETVRFPLPAAVEGASALSFRFLFSSGVSSSTTSANASRAATAPGWFFDDMRVEAQ